MILMESLSIALSASPPLKNHHKTLKPTTPKPIFLPNSPPTIPTFNSIQTHFPISKIPLSLPKISPFAQTFTKSHLSFTLIDLLASLPCFASETITPTEQASDKINLESILVSIDDFFNRNPFFVAGCIFIWLVVLPLTQGYLSKCKYISAIDAFRKLRDDPNSQLLDIRERKSFEYLGSPNLKILNKEVVRVQFSEGDEDDFVKKVLENFTHPNTVLCVLDNFDGNSLKVAELLFKNGFKEAYAIRGGVRGKKGWLAIQETLLPPSVHIRRKKKVKITQLPEMNGGINPHNTDRDEASSSTSVPIVGSQGMDNGHVNKKTASRSSSPYPNYPDMKPPSSPTPSKP